MNMADNVRSMTGMGREDIDSAKRWADYIEKDLNDARLSLAMRDTSSDEFCKIIERCIDKYNSRTKNRKDKLILSDDEKNSYTWSF